MKTYIRTIWSVLLGFSLAIMFLPAAQAQTVKVSSGQDAASSSDNKDYQAFYLGEFYVKGEKVPGIYKMTEVTEIKPEQFETAYSQTVAEALTYIPGVLVTKGFRNEPTVRIHGFVQNKTLVLIDGVPYYEAV